MHDLKEHLKSKLLKAKEKKFCKQPRCYFYGNYYSNDCRGQKGVTKHPSSPQRNSALRESTLQEGRGNTDAPRGGKAALAAGCPALHNCQVLQTEENNKGNLKHQGQPTPRSENRLLPSSPSTPPHLSRPLPSDKPPVPFLKAHTLRQGI